MTRNWGISSTTSRETVGGIDQSLGSLHSANNTRADNVIPFSRLTERQARQLNSQRHSIVAGPFIPEPIDHRNFAAWFLVAGFVLSPVVTVSIAILIYALLIA